MSLPPKMVLYPQVAEMVPLDAGQLIESLNEAGLIGESFEYLEQSHYEAGEHFLELVSFLGCSPVIGLEPTEDDDNFCHIHIEGPLSDVVFLYSPGEVNPRCPKCRYPVQEWQHLIEQWHDDELCRLWECPECGEETDLYQMNWRQMAGFGSFFIEIWGIFPHEAVPTETLLNQLASHTPGVSWSFFYA